MTTNRCIREGTKNTDGNYYSMRNWRAKVLGLIIFISPLLVTSFHTHYTGRTDSTVFSSGLLHRETPHGPVFAALLLSTG